MNAYIIVIFAFLVTWTVLLGLLFHLCLRAVRWLERQVLSAADARGRDTWPPAPASLSRKDSGPGVTGSKVPEEPDMARINEKLDTEEAQKSATRKENVRLVGDNLFSEESLEGDTQGVIDNIKKLKNS